MAWPVSDEFADALHRDHDVVSKAEVLDNGSVAATLDVLDGDVRIDSGRTTRRSCSVTLTLQEHDDLSVVPAKLSDLLGPGGSEIKLYRGIRLPGGDEFVPLGVFRITDANTRDSGNNLTIRVKGRDRTETVSRARFTDTYVVPSGTNVADAIKNIITSRTNFTSFSFMNTTYTAPRLVGEAGDDPWKMATAMADSMGAVLYFSAGGTCVLEPEPDPAETSPVFTFREGVDSTMVRVESRVTSERTYNHIIVTGESTELSGPIRAEAQDDDPTSPTYVDGDFGDIPFFISSKFITTQAQAQDAADAQLLRTLRLTRRASLSAVPAPQLDAFDVVSVKRDRVKVDRDIVISSLFIPMSANGVMRIISSERRG